jgi:tRNA1Val (adenine37-N6)-methyltransferase
VTRDALWGGRISLVQPRRGYRVNADALLLAAFARSFRDVDTTYDLGAGSGAVALALLASDATRRAVLVERDRTQAALAARNVEDNGFAQRATVVIGSVTDEGLLPRGEANLVVCNPPYTDPSRGRVASGPRGPARSGDLAGFARAARAVLGARGRACLCYPASELFRALATLDAVGLHPKTLRMVHATPRAPARILLVAAQPGRPGGLEVRPPLHEWASPGVPSDEARDALRGPPLA